MYRNKAFRTAGVALEFAAWIFLGFAFISLVMNTRSIASLLSTRIMWDRLPQEENAPIEVLLNTRKVALDCLSGASSNSSGRVRDRGTRLQGVYNLYYHARIDSEKWGRVAFLRKSPHRPVGPQREAYLGDCVAARFLSSEMGSNPSRIDSRIVWIYMFIEKGEQGEFIFWPDAEIPVDFLPWERPWYRDNVVRQHKSQRSVNGLTIYQTKPFNDAFTRDQIVSLVFPESIGPYKMTTVIDLRAGTTPGTYGGILCINFLIACAISILSFFTANSLRTHYLTAWYRAWLGVAILYALIAYSYFVENPITVLGSLGSRESVLLPILSIANSGFFLLAALYLRANFDSKRARFVAMTASIFVLTIGTIAHMLEGRWATSVPLADTIESIFSAVTFMVLGISLIKVLNNSGDSLQKIGWSLNPFREPWNISWNTVGGWMILALFILSSVLQLSIPFWQRFPRAEDVFWMFSVPLKVGIVATFYVVILIGLYSEKVRANDLFASVIRQGVFVVDKDFAVVSVNSYAESMVNLSQQFMRRKLLLQVVFSSLFEAEHIYAQIRAGALVEDVKVRTKRFRSGREDLEDIEEVERGLAACPIGQGVSGGEFAIFILSDKE